MRQRFYMGSFLLVFLLTVAACSNQPAQKKIQSGDKVTLDYTLSTQGHVFESSKNKGNKPLTYLQGEQANILPGVNSSALAGMSVGQEKTIVVPAEKAFGKIDPKGFVAVPLSTLPEGMDKKIGMMFQIKGPDGREHPAVIVEIQGDKAILNFNHPLAGKDITVNLKVLDVK